MKSPLPGEIWIADLGYAAKVRPVVIISRHDPDAPKALISYVPVTTQPRGGDYEVGLSGVTGLDANSVADIQSLGTLPIPRYSRRIGSVPEELMEEIKTTLKFALELGMF